MPDTAGAGPIDGPRGTAQSGAEEAPEPDHRPRLHVVEAAVRTKSAVTTETANPAEAIPQIQVDAWHWALDNRREDGSLPTGREIASHFDHKDRWGRLIKQWGQQGRLNQAAV